VDVVEEEGESREGGESTEGPSRSLALGGFEKWWVRCLLKRLDEGRRRGERG
jgi:hypothetical protein